MRYLEMKRPAEPHLHQIEPTNHCPYTCIMCPRHGHMKRKTGFMEFPLFQRVMDEVASYAEPVRSKEIELFHFGESLLHPEIDRMVGWASSRKLNVTLSVNGPELKPELARRILENQPFRIIVSLDGNDPETYRAIRGRNADFELACRNIEALAALRRSLGSATKVTVRMIEMDRNDGQAGAMARRWEEKGVDVEVRRFFPWGEHDLASLGSYDKYPPGMPCPFPWQYLVVQWNGDVVPCCRDYNGTLALGNVKESTLKEIWQGGRYEEFRRQMAAGECRDNTVCGDCLALYCTDPVPPQPAGPTA